MSQIVDLLRKGDRLTLLIRFSATPEQATADVFEDYISLMEECDFLRGEVDRLRYVQEDQQSTISRLEEQVRHSEAEVVQARHRQSRDLEDLQSKVYRLERENRNRR